ncbi:MAG: response regulator transcription factor [Planctomycetota bacterium]
MSRSVDMPDKTSNATIRTLLIDDHAVVRAGVRAVIDGESARDGRIFEVVGEASGGQEGVQLYSELRPDLAIVDLRLPDMPGQAVVRRIRVNHPDAKLLVLTSFDAEEDVAECVSSGALGYALKESSADQMIEAMSSVAEGRRWLCPEAADRLAERMTHESLTDREVEVLVLAARGLANKEIAADLRCAAGTVKVHLANIFAKLRAESRTEAVSIARTRGWIRGDD